MQSVMAYKEKSHSYTDDYPNPDPYDVTFQMKQILYDEYLEAKKYDFEGTYEQYLQYRDYI